MSLLEHELNFLNWQLSQNLKQCFHFSHKFKLHLKWSAFYLGQKTTTVFQLSKDFRQSAILKKIFFCWFKHTTCWAAVIIIFHLLNENTWTLIWDVFRKGPLNWSTFEVIFWKNKNIFIIFLKLFLHPKYICWMIHNSFYEWLMQNYFCTMQKFEMPTKLVGAQSNNLNWKEKFGLRVNNEFYVRDFCWWKKKLYLFVLILRHAML